MHGPILSAAAFFAGPRVSRVGQGHGALPADEGLDALYRREAPGLARYFRRHLRSRDDAADLVQEVFARMLGADADASPRRPAAYLQRIARNLLFDHGRRAASHRADHHLPLADAGQIASPPDQGLAIEADDVMRRYARALAELPERTRTAFLLSRGDGLGYAAIGIELGISVPTVQYHVARALAHIGRVLEQE